MTQVQLDHNQNLKHGLTLNKFSKANLRSLNFSSKGKEPVFVYINITILAYPSINTMALQFTADYYINLRW